jgi:hypothetical protein
MNLYYALGGGLGHVTRARAFLHTFELENNSVILASSPFLPDERITGKIQTIRVDRFYNRNIPAFQEFLRIILDKYSIDKFFIDTFPVGIGGEFGGFDFPPNVIINYVARLLKWREYLGSLENANLPQFATTYLLEPLAQEHAEFINKYSQGLINIELNYPEIQLSPENEMDFRIIINEKKPFWLIAHSGGIEEASELINYADEMRQIEKRKVNIILISPHDLISPEIPNLFVFNLYPAQVLFAHAERIFSGCGFNVMEQTRGFRNKHVFIPFERRFDDQFQRARRIRAESTTRTKFGSGN